MSVYWGGKNNYYICKMRHFTSITQLGDLGKALEAAKYVTEKGIDMYITIGSHPENIYALLEGKEVGTHFLKQ